MVVNTVTSKYTHLPLGQDVEAFAGYYTPEKEVRLPCGAREVLYVTGHVIVETSCSPGMACQTDHWYAIVPGYVTSWQSEVSARGLPVTTVELIRDKATRQTLQELILKNEAVTRVDFW